MKKVFIYYACIFFGIGNLFSQTDTAKSTFDTLYFITTIDGAEFVGVIISQDEKEVVIDSKERGKISIPKYQISEMKALNVGDLSVNGYYIPAEIFSTRYFLTTNGLPIKKGESYVLWSLWGPDLEFGIADNFSIGLMTTWIAYPIIGNAKYSIPLSKNLNLGLGVVLGTTTWGYSDFHFSVALPYAALTIGDRKNNLTFSGGFGGIWSEDGSSGNSLFSVAGMSKVGEKITLVFDSFIVPPESSDKSIFALVIPGIRLQTQSKSAFQFGFTGIIAGGETLPFPIPTLQWFRQL